MSKHGVPHYFNSVITKYNTQEFIDGTYFERAKELGANAVSFTFVEDRSDVDYSLLPDRQTMTDVCNSILEHIKSGKKPAGDDTSGIFPTDSQSRAWTV